MVRRHGRPIVTLRLAFAALHLHRSMQETHEASVYLKTCLDEGKVGLIGVAGHPGG